MKVTMYPAATLDGFIADPSGECYSWINDEDEAGYEQAMKRCGADIIGRKTYEQYKEEYDTKRDIVTFVCTTSDIYKDTANLKFINGTAQELYKTIEDAGFSEVILSGGGEINGLFASAGLVDEIIISVYNLILGDGIRLFGSFHPHLKLELLGSIEEIKGIVQNHYRVIKGTGDNR